MDYIIGVRFKKTGKLHILDPLHFEFQLGDNVLANSERGEELGRVVKIIKLEDYKSNESLEKVIRPATKRDLEIFRDYELKAEEALKTCKKMVSRFNLNMKPLCADYTFDGAKLTFYFVSEDRVDFRDLVKELAMKYKARIELRQIGPRDEIKVYPNLGMCGKEVCCRTHLQDFEPVTIKMAKEQGLQINMAKLSGACGKLMCCLKYEENTYKENLKLLPKVGEFVTVKGSNDTGKVVNVDILGLKIKVKFGNDKEDEHFEIYPVDKVKWNNKAKE